MAQDVTFDIIGRDRASAAFRNVGRSAKDSEGSLTKFAGVARKVFAAALIYEGAKKATEGLKSLAEAAAEDQVSSRLMAKQFRNSAHATREQIAATEDWITAQGRAKGVADDDLRPALANLVTATHNVGKARQLATLAEDIAAAKGKSLSTVSLALTKAYNGNVGGLGRLGIKTKDAKGKTLDFAAAQKQLTKEFGGAAAAKAKTFSGVMDRFKVVVQETKESLGAKLLPVLTRLGDWFLATGGPAIGRFAGVVQSKLTPVLQAVAHFIASDVVPWFKKFGDASSQQGKLLRQYGAYLKAVFANVASILQSAGVIASTFWKKYGDLITRYGVGTLKNAVQVIRGIFDVLAGLFKVVADVMKGDWSGAWNGIKQITKGAGEILGGLVRQALNTVATLFKVAWTSMRNVASSAWHGIAGIVSRGGASIVNGVRAIPGRIGKLAGAFRAVGTALINAFVDGLSKAAGIVGKIASGIWSALKGMLNGAIDKLNSALEFHINKGPVRISVNPPDIPHLARGGVVKARPGGTLALLGEGGSDEAVVPLSGPHARRVGSGGVTININISGALDPLAVGRQVEQALAQLKNSRAGRPLAFAV